MKRAKCKLCGIILECGNNLEYVSCTCGEITVDMITGDFHAYIKSDKKNLIMVDEEGNEIIPKKVEELEEIDLGERENLIQMLENMVVNIKHLPDHARTSAVTHSDLESVLSLIVGIFRAC